MYSNNNETGPGGKPVSDTGAGSARPANDTGFSSQATDTDYSSPAAEARATWPLPDSPDLRAGWQSWLNEQALQGMTIKMVPLIGILFLFVYTDIVILHNLTISLLRLIPITLAFTLLFLHLTTEGYETGKRHLYHVLLVTLLIMMYARIILLTDDPHLGGSLAGLLLVVLIVSLELRTNLMATLSVYLLPPVAFTIFSFYPENVWDTSYFNIYPMVIAGLMFNTFQGRYNFQTFTSQFMLAREKQRAETLYHEAREHNTAMNRTNELLRNSEQSLRDELQTREKLISIIAHDIRNPFNILTGYSDIIRSEAHSLSREEISGYAGQINNSSQSILNLIDNLLSWVRAQTGKISLDPRPHSVSGLLNEVIDVMTVQAESKKIRLDVAIPSDLLIEVDYATMSTVFRNLLSNAIKFTPSGGQVTISAEKQQDHDGSFASASIKIRDTGVGFPGEHLDDLIQENKITSRPGTENEKGTGLGLAICRDFVKRNGGKLTARSIPDEGSEFVVTLPYR